MNVVHPSNDLTVIGVLADPMLVDRLVGPVVFLFADEQCADDRRRRRRFRVANVLTVFILPSKPPKSSSRFRAPARRGLTFFRNFRHQPTRHTPQPWTIILYPSLLHLIPSFARRHHPADTQMTSKYPYLRQGRAKMLSIPALLYMIHLERGPLAIHPNPLCCTPAFGHPL